MRSMTTLLSDQQGAVLARMGSDTTYDNSIPNAWMASTPGHGFWLFAAFQVGCMVLRYTCHLCNHPKFT